MSTIKSSAENLTLNADGANNDIKFQSNGSEVASIDQAGNIALSGTVDGVDVSARDSVLTSTTATAAAALPLAGGTLTGNTTIAVSSTPKLILKRTGNNAGNGYIECHGADDSVDYKIAFAQTAGAMTFSTATSNAMIIDSSGHVGVGAGSTSGNSKVYMEASSSKHGLEIYHHSYYSPSAMITNNADSVARTGYPMTFIRNGNTVGSISGSLSATAYNTSSDYRLKENVDYTWDATTRLKQLKPARFNFIVDDTNTLVDGFIAHEVSSVVPEAISGTKDAMMDEEYEVTPAVMDGDTVVTEAVMGTRSVPDMQGIDQSKLVPLLVKTIQELEARITALEA